MKNGFASASDRAAAEAALNVPAIPFAFAQLFTDFLTLDARRPPAMSGLSPIPISEMSGYGAAIYGGYAAHEIETLIQLDSLRMRCASDEHFVETFFEQLTAEPS